MAREDDEPADETKRREKHSLLRHGFIPEHPHSDPNNPKWDPREVDRPLQREEYAPGPPWGSGGKYTQNQQVMSDAGPQKTLLFLHGMESRYGKTKPAQIEAQAKSYADKRGMRFEAIPISGDKHGEQLRAAQARVKQGGVGAVLGFSAGGYTAAKLKAPGVEKIIVGAPKAQGNISTPGRHMDAVKNIPAPRGQQSRFQPQPLPPGQSRPPADVPGGAVDYLARTASGSRTMSNQGGATAAISRLNPQFASRLQSGIQALRANGYPNAGIQSAFRTGSGSAGTGSSFDRAGKSLHSIGAAVDLAGIGGAGSKEAERAHQILSQHGVYGPYGYKNHAEYNHFQMVPQKSVAQFGDTAKVRQYAGSHLPSDEQLHQLWGMTPGQRAPSTPPQQRAQQQATKLPTVGQLIKENVQKPEFSQYSAYAGAIPDQNLPVDQWKQKHADLYNNPMAAPFRSIFDKSMQATPPATPAAAKPPQQPAMPPSFPPMPPQRPQTAGQQPQQPGQGPPPGAGPATGQLSTAGNPLNIPTNLTQSEQRGISQFASGLPRQPTAAGPATGQPQQQPGTPPPAFPPMPQPRPMSAPQSMQDIAVNNIRPPDQQIAQPQQGAGWGRPTAGPAMAPQPQAPQPQSAQQMPDFAKGTGGYNDEYGIHSPYGPQTVTPTPPPMPQPTASGPAQQQSMGAGLNAGTPPIGGTDWALPSNRSSMNPGNIQPGLSGGTPFPFSGGGGMGAPDMGGGGAPIQLGVGGGDMGGGSFGGMGGGFGGGGDAGGMGGGGMGGGGGHGSKVNMQAAMQMIPKPIAMPNIQVTPPTEGGITPIKPQAPLPPNAGGNTNLAQTIAQFLQPSDQQS